MQVEINGSLFTRLGSHHILITVSVYGGKAYDINAKHFHRAK